MNRDSDSLDMSNRTVT